MLRESNQTDNTRSGTDLTKRSATSNSTHHLRIKRIYCIWDDFGQRRCLIHSRCEHNLMCVCVRPPPTRRTPSATLFPNGCRQQIASLFLSIVPGTCSDFSLTVALFSAIHSFSPCSIFLSSSRACICLNILFIVDGLLSLIVFCRHVFSFCAQRLCVVPPDVLFTRQRCTVVGFFAS